MKQYIDWHGVLIFLAVLIAQAFGAAYPYINPANPQYLQAIQAVCYILALAIYQHGRVTTNARVGVVESSLVGGPTRPQRAIELPPQG